MNRPDFTLDLLPEVPGLSKFQSSFNKRMNAKIGEVTAPVISYEDLLISKEKLARAKDMEDIKELGLRKGRRPK